MWAAFLSAVYEPLLIYQGMNTWTLMAVHKRDTKMLHQLFMLSHCTIFSLNKAAMKCFSLQSALVICMLLKIYEILQFAAVVHIVFSLNSILRIHLSEAKK